MQRKINFTGFYFLSEEIFFERLIYFERLYITPIYKEKYNRRFYQTDTIFVRVISLFLIRLILVILYSMKKPLSPGMEDNGFLISVLPHFRLTGRTAIQSELR